MYDSTEVNQLRSPHIIFLFERKYIIEKGLSYITHKIKLDSMHDKSRGDILTALSIIAALTNLQYFIDAFYLSIRIRFSL